MIALRKQEPVRPQEFPKATLKPIPAWFWEHGAPARKQEYLNQRNKTREVLREGLTQAANDDVYPWLTSDHVDDYLDFIDLYKRTFIQFKYFKRQQNKVFDIARHFWNELPKSLQSDALWDRMCNEIRGAIIGKIIFVDRSGVVYTDKFPSGLKRNVTDDDTRREFLKVIKAVKNAVGGNVSFTGKLGTVYTSRFTDGVDDSGGGGVGGSDWVGVPDPTSAVPRCNTTSGCQESTSALQAPVPGDFDNHDWINSYDPLTYVPSDPGGSLSYYVNGSTGNDTTAGNGGNGTAGAPRASIPTSMPPGAYVIIAGGTFNFSGSDVTYSSTSTKQNPAFFQMSGSAQITGNGAIPRFAGKHIIFDSLNIGGSRPRFQGSGSGIEYITIRNSYFTSTQQSFGGSIINCGSGTDEAPNRFFVFYNNNFENIGVTPKTTSQDYHCIQPTGRCRYIWIIGNTGIDINGDFVQMNNSYNNVDNSAPNAYPHFTWVAGNVVSRCGEQSVDCKGSYHVIVSQNISLDMDIHGTGANTTNILLSNNAEAEYSGPHWAILNFVRNNGTGDGIRDSGTCNDDLNYIIGNIILNCTNGITIDYGGTIPGSSSTLTRQRTSTSVNNTIDGVGYGTRHPRANSFLDVYYHANIITNTSTYAHYLVNANSFTLTLNLYFNSAGSVTMGPGFSGEVQPGYSAANEFYNEDPLYEDPGTATTNSFALTTGSPALIIGTKHAAYTTFETWYGLSIYKYFDHAFTSSAADREAVLSNLGTEAAA